MYAESQRHTKLKHTYKHQHTHLTRDLETSYFICHALDWRKFVLQEHVILTDDSPLASFHTNYRCYVHETLVQPIDPETPWDDCSQCLPTRATTPQKLPISGATSISMAKAVRHRDRRHQTPCVNAICHPCAHNLHPASPICPSNSCKITSVLEINVLREQGSNPACRQQKDDVEKGVVVLCASSLIVFATVAVIGLFFVFIIIVKSISRQTASFDRSTEGFGPHFTARRRGLGVHETMLCGIF